MAKLQRYVAGLRDVLIDWESMFSFRIQLLRFLIL